MQDISQWSKYKEDIKSSTTLGAIQDALTDPLYTGGLLTDYETIMAIKAIVDKATPPESNTIDANTGLRYTAEQTNALLDCSKTN
jgi:hypothetical protein